MKDILQEAEWDVQLATGWSCEAMDDLEAERLLILHLRWQYNQMRYSGMLSLGKSTPIARTPADSVRAEHWRSQTKESADGRITKRINIEDLWNPAALGMVNNLRG